MAIKDNTFKKEERLCSKRLLNSLFASSSSFLLYPFRVVWKESEDLTQKYPAQVVISVPKKRFKHSVDRNLIKRRIREAYRKNKGDLLYKALVEDNQKIVFSINYVGKEILDYHFLEEKMVKMLKMLVKQLKDA
ncbi:ribonuclease P protein component [Pseudopedobacter beijingensis]|uniref:Ribonuclease P protein component n=1 Tax=Pseudopedobacter beijingensis TaxID=1207056 RepID=A0ABW4IHI0_9SPHI